MPRLFAAIDLPPHIQHLPAELAAPYIHARWVAAGQAHLTLRFIGEVHETTCTDITEALAGVRAEPFEMQLAGVGVFPNARLPRVLWAGVEAPEKLFQMQSRIETALRTVGVPPSDQPFHPHITLARLKKPQAGSVRRFLKEKAGLTSPPVPVTAFILYRSDLSPSGARYVPERRYTLR